MAVQIRGVCAARAVAEVVQLAHQVPLALPAQLRRIHLPIAFGLCAVTVAAGGEQRLTCLRIARDRSLRLCERRLLRRPFFELELFVYHDASSHREMRSAAELLAECVELAGAGRREPEVGDHARHHVHLHAKLRHSELMIHVLRAQQHLHWFVERHVQFGTCDQQIVLSGRIAHVDAERIVEAHQSDVALAELCVSPGKPIAPVPLLAEHLDDRCVVGHGHELRPDRKTRREHCRDADGGEHGQPPFELAILGFVVRLRSILAMAIANDRVGEKGVDQDEDDSRDPESHMDGVVHHLPVGRDRREPPRAQEMKQHRAQDEQNKHNCDRHLCTPSFRFRRLSARNEEIRSLNGVGAEVALRRAN